MRKFTLMLALLVGCLCVHAATIDKKPIRLLGERARHDGPSKKANSILTLDEAIASGPVKARKAAPMATTATGKQMIATVIYEDDWGGGLQPYRIKSFNIEASPITAEEIVGPGPIDVGIYIDNNDYLVLHEGIDEAGRLWNTVIYRYDMDAVRVTDQYMLEPQIRVYSGATDPITKIVYTFCAVDEGTGPVTQLMTYNPDTHHFARVAYLPAVSVPVMMFDNTGQLYWHELSDGKLYKMDKTTGEKTLVGSTGIKHQYKTSGCIDLDDNTCYIANNTDQSAGLYKVDLKTAKSQFIGAMPKSAEITGAYIPPVPPAETAPNEATKVVFNFEKGALSGTLDCVAPTKTIAGKRMNSTTELTYTLNRNGEEVATGTCAPGEPVSIPLSFDRPDTYKFDFYFSNESGRGKKMLLSQWIGYDVPDKMDRPVLSRKNGKFILTWKEPTSLLKDGLEGSDLSYVLRRNDGVVHEVGNVTSFEEDYPAGVTAFTAYSYNVTPVYRGFPYKDVDSNTAYLGGVEESYLNMFSTEEEGYHFTAEDCDGDGNTWEWDRMYRNYVAGGHVNTVKDDWLFSPGIHMKAGHSYPIMFEIWKELVGYQDYFEVCIGTSPEASAMTAVILPMTEITETYNEVLQPDLWQRLSYTAPTTDIYYVGIHTKNDFGATKVSVDNFIVDYSSVPTTPGAVENLQVIPGALGAMNATVKFRAPSLDITGNPLKELDCVKIVRDGILVATLTPAPGEEVSYVDNVSAKGTHSYIVMCEGSDTTGPRTPGECYVGYDIPPAVANLKPEVTNFTRVNISWDKVDADINGLAYAPGAVEYELFVYQNNELVPMGKTSANGAAFDYTNPEQYYFLFAVRTWAEDMGSEDYAVSDMVLVGKPYSLPFYESFEETRAHHPWFVQNDNQMHGNWYLMDDATFNQDEDQLLYGLKSVDHDNGFIGYQGFFPGDNSMFFCGNIELSGRSKNPTLNFYHLVEPENQNTIDIMYKKPDGEWEKLETVSLAGDNTEWKEENIDLSSLKGSMIKGSAFQLGMKANIVNKDYVIIDNMKVYYRPDYNERVKGPYEIDATVGQPAKVPFVVENNGLKDIGTATLKISVNDEEAETIDIPALKVGESYKTEFEFTLTPHAPELNLLSAEVISSEDEYDLDDLFITEVNTIYSVFPGPRDLKAEKSEDGSVALNWTEPDPELYPRIGDVEDFESYTDMQTDGIGEWTIYASGNPKLELSPLEWPEINGEPVGFFIIDVKADPKVKPLGYTAHTGNKYIATVYNKELVPNDEWLISPELSGKARTINFWVRSALPNWREDIEVLISSTGKEKEDFTVKVLQDYLVPAEWTNVELDIPEGTKYVALRSVANGKGMLMVDDIDLKNGKPVEADFLGYNVYRDGKALNESPVAEKNYLDATAGDKHSYRVTAAYTVGESRISNTAVINFSSVTDVENSLVKVFGVAGRIVVRGAIDRNVEISDVSGIRVKSLKADTNEVMVNVDKGIYIVTVDGHSVKVIVK